MKSSTLADRRALFGRVFARHFQSRRLVQRPLSFGVEALQQRLALDGSDPLRVVLQAPDTDNHILLQFNRPVTGVDLGDFRLMHDDTNIEFNTAQLETISAQDYVLTLPELFDDGQYLLELVADDSGIADAADPQQLLDENGTIAWVRDTLGPSLNFSWSLPQTVLEQKWRVAALGDSQTTETGSSYVPYLRQQLSSAEYSVEIFAEAGWRASQVQQLWDSSVKDADFDVAVFFAGVNDLISTEQSAEVIFATLSTMFDEALARGMSVVAVGVSPWSHYQASTQAKQARTEALNSLIAQYASEHSSSVRYVDSRVALASLTDASRLSTRYDSYDGLHLSAAGDKRLATLIQQAIMELQPASTIPASVTIEISEPVVTVSTANFRLLRNDQAYEFVTTELSPGTLRLDFAIPSGDLADYQVQWIGTDPIVDLHGNALQSPTSSSISVDRQSPTALMTTSQPAVSYQAVNQIDLQFTEPVTGLGLNNFELTLSGRTVDLTWATLTTIDSARYQLHLGATALLDGNYRLALRSNESSPRDLSGNPLQVSSIVEWVTLTSQPSVVDGVLSVNSTSETESVELNLFGDRLDMWIGGMVLSISLDGVREINFGSLAGLDNVAIELLDQPGTPPSTPWLKIRATSSDQADYITLYGIAGNDSFQSSGPVVTLTNSLVEWTVSDFAVVNVYANSASMTTTSTTTGIDTANFMGTSRTERFTGRPDISTWSAPNYQHNVHDFRSVTATGSGRGDTAILYDSAGDDSYTGSPASGLLTGTGFSLQVNSFPVVSLICRQGQDSAVLVGSSGADTFVAQSTSTAFSGTGFRHSLTNVDTIEASGNGGNDVASMYDTASADVVELSPLNGRMTRPNSVSIVKQFPRINAYARFGADSVTMTGSPGVDTFTGQESSSAMVGPGYGLYAYKFPVVTAIGTGRGDIARLYDSTSDDQLNSIPTATTLTTPTYSLIAQQFPTVYAYARTGNDVANMSGSSGVETYNGYPTYGLLTGSGLTQFAYGFDVVNVTSGGGADVANLYDSNGDDSFASSPTRAVLLGPGFQHATNGFTRTNAYARAGNDVAQLDGSSGPDSFNGQVNASFMISGPVSNYAYAFDRVTSDSLGGNDTANLYDSTGDDWLVASANSVTLSDTAFQNTANNFSRVNAFGRSGNDRAQLNGSTSSETVLVRTDYSYIKNASYMNYVSGFKIIEANGGGGNDTLFLYDSAGNDQVTIGLRSATMLNSGFQAILNGFFRINAYASSGDDRVTLSDTIGNDTYTGRGKLGTLSGGGFVANVDSFDTVVLAPAIGGTNTLRITDLTYNLEVGLGWQ